MALRRGVISSLAIALFIFFGAGHAVAAVTPTTIIPLIAFMNLSPTSGPPGTVVSVSNSTVAGHGGVVCVAPGKWILVTLSRASAPNTPIESKTVTLDSSHRFTTTLTIPAGDAPQKYSINARCEQSDSTVFYFEPEVFDSAQPLPTTSTSRSTIPVSQTTVGASTSTSVAEAATSTSLATTTAPVASDPTTTSVTVEAAGDTIAADPSAPLPLTGGSSATGLVLGASLVVGGVLLLSRRRATKP
jgi:LPXTG-motif cell wall-anchored protein